MVPTNMAKQSIVEDQPKDLKALVSDNPAYIQFISNPSEAVQAAAVKKDVWAIQYIAHPTPAIKKYVLTKEPQALVYIEEVTEEEVLMAVTKDGSLIKYMDEITPAIQVAAVVQNGYNIEYIKDPILEVQHKALLTVEGIGVFRKNRGIFNIEELSNTYEDMSVLFAAIDLDLTEKDILSIMIYTSIDKMWEDLVNRVRDRVAKDGLELRWLPSRLKTPELCKIAVSQNGLAIEYVPAELKSVELALIAVSKKPMAIQYIPSIQRTEDVCLVAVEGDPDTYNFLGIENRTVKVSEEAVRYKGELFTKVPKDIINELICKRSVKQKGRLIKEVPEEFLTPFICLLAYSDYEVLDNKQEFTSFEENAIKACPDLEELLTNGTNSSAIVSHVRMIVERMEKKSAAANV